jgi:signal transduction histidine kinase
MMATMQRKLKLPLKLVLQSAELLLADTNHDERQL